MDKEVERKICLSLCREQENCIECIKYFTWIKQPPCRYYGKKHKESIWDKEEK